VRNVTHGARAGREAAAMTFAGGALIFLGFIVFYTLAVTFSLYSRRGSGINQRPHGGNYTSAPGARGASGLVHDRVAARNLTRGTKA
jgi:hypothetical protein